MNDLRNSTLEEIINIVSADHVIANVIYDDSWINECFIAGHDEITIGKFDDEEYELLCFFHEIGHVVSNYDYSKGHYSRYSYELDCWARGIEIARSHYHILFQDATIQRALNEHLSSYVGHDARECTTDFSQEFWALRRDSSVQL
jgi:hypothetical protein